MKSNNTEDISMLADALVSTMSAVEMYISRDSWVKDKFHTCLRLAFWMGQKYRDMTREDWSNDD